VYRVEAAWPGANAPWIVSNPIVLADGRFSSATTPPAVPPPSEQREIATTSASWAVEREPSSSGEFRVESGTMRFDFHLGPGAPHGQFAAIASPVSPDAGVDRVMFDAHADRPMRVSLQVRIAGGKEGQRWRRSVYLDTAERPIAVRLQDFETADAPTTRRPIVAPIEALLFVVDTVNTPPGRAGTVWLSNVRIGIDRLTH
jgi:hypothetical protein